MQQEIIYWDEIKNYFNDVSQIITLTDRKISGIDNYISYNIEYQKTIFSYSIYLENNLNSIFNSTSITPVEDISRFINNKSRNKKSHHKISSIDSFDNLYESIEQEGWDWSIKMLKSTQIGRFPALNIKIDNGYRANVVVDEIIYDYLFQIIDYPRLTEKGTTNNPIIDFSDFSGSKDVMDAEDDRNLRAESYDIDSYDSEPYESIRILPEPTKQENRSFPPPGPEWGPDTLRSGNIYNQYLDTIYLGIN